MTPSSYSSNPPALTATKPEVAQPIVNLRRELAAGVLDAGSAMIHWHHECHHQIKAPISTIRRRLAEAGLARPKLMKKPSDPDLGAAAEWAIAFSAVDPGGSRPWQSCQFYPQ